MRKPILLAAICVIAAIAVVFSNHHPTVGAQQRGGLTPDQVARRNSVEQELESVAIIDRKLMIPMRDGKRMAADVYRPKDTSKKCPTVSSVVRKPGSGPTRKGGRKEIDPLNQWINETMNQSYLCNLRNLRIPRSAFRSDLAVGSAH